MMLALGTQHTVSFGSNGQNERKKEKKSVKQNTIGIRRQQEK